MTSSGKGYRFVTNLGSGHPGAAGFRIASEQEHRQESAPPPGPVAFVNVAVDDAIDDGLVTKETARRGNWESVKEAAERAAATADHVATHDVDGIPNLPDLSGNLGVEEALDDYAQSQFHQLLVYVDLVTLLPTARVLERVVDHYLRIDRDSFLVERGLDKTPLPQVEIALAGDEPLAKTHFHGLLHWALAHIHMMRDDEVPYMIRMIEQVGFEWPPGKKNNITEVADGPSHQAQRIAYEGQQSTDDGQPSWSGWYGYTCRLWRSGHVTCNKLGV